MLGGILLGAGLTVAVLALGRGHGEGLSAAAIRPSCGVSIVLVEPDAVSRIIDAATGGHGFSHVVVDGCEVDGEGRPLLIDCQPGLGVARVPESTYAGRGRVRVWMPLCEGRELYGCVRALVGQPYDLLGLVMPKQGLAGGLICSQLVYECLPRRLQALVPPWPRDRPVAPNDLARAFGARPGREPIVLQGSATT
jgi:hypothetical protein